MKGRTLDEVAGIWQEYCPLYQLDRIIPEFYPKGVITGSCPSPHWLPALERLLTQAVKEGQALDNLKLAFRYDVRRPGNRYTMLDILDLQAGTKTAEHEGTLLADFCWKVDEHWKDAEFGHRQHLYRLAVVAAYFVDVGEMDPLLQLFVESADKFI